MSDPKDIVGKADAFLGRYRPAAAAEDLPLLTEVVDLPHAGDAAGHGSKQAAGSPLSPALSESELHAIERQITQRVLETLQPTLSGFLGEPLRIMLQDRLEQALGNLAEQCRTDIEAIVREAVAKALERETAQLGPQRGAGRS